MSKISVLVIVRDFIASFWEPARVRFLLCLAVTIAGAVGLSWRHQVDAGCAQLLAVVSPLLAIALLNVIFLLLRFSASPPRRSTERDARSAMLRRLFSRASFSMLLAALVGVAALAAVMTGLAGAPALSFAIHLLVCWLAFSVASIVGPLHSLLAGEFDPD